MPQPFQIFHLNLQQAKDFANTPSEQHHHDFEELLIGATGTIDHSIDYNSAAVKSPFVSFTAKGKVHAIIPFGGDTEFSTWVIRFKSEFIPENTFQFYAYHHNQAIFTLQKSACFERMMSICELMQSEMNANEPNYAILRCLLNTLFTMIEAEKSRSVPGNHFHPKIQHLAFKKFLTILEDHYKSRTHGVNFYAERLCMSVRNLNLICHQVLQQSVSEIIENRKLTEAKKLLITTLMTISEIGYELGYKENSYFTSVFRKKTGQTPSEFRDRMKRLIA